MEGDVGGVFARGKEAAWVLEEMFYVWGREGLPAHKSPFASKANTSIHSYYFLEPLELLIDEHITSVPTICEGWICEYNPDAARDTGLTFGFSDFVHSEKDNNRTRSVLK